MTPETPAAGREAWVAWAGGDQPEDDDVWIEVETRGGARYQGYAAGFFRGRWQHSPYVPEMGHIIAYRIVRSSPTSLVGGG